jgi:hypothetical protein
LGKAERLEKWHGKKSNVVTRKEERPSCKNYRKEGHDEDHCWKLHPDKRLKWFKEKKGRKIVAATT